MSELRDVQLFFAAHLTGLRALQKQPEVAAQAEHWFTGNARVSPAEQLEIYRQQFWLRHTAALVEDFPGLSGILGQKDWERLSESYLTERRCTSWTLRDLGAELPAHVEQSAWLAHQDLCADMAHLEWAYVSAFDAATAPPLNPEKVTGLTEEQWQTVVVAFDPSLRLLKVRYPVAELRRALMDHSSHAPVQIPDPMALNLVVYRGANRNLFHSKLSDAAFELLTLLRAGRPLVAACEDVVAAHGASHATLEGKVFEWFQDWGQRGWIVDLHAG